jgi:hypothetical protein
MAIWLAVKYSGKPDEFKKFVETCQKEGREMRIATDEKGRESEVFNICRESGIKGLDAALISDRSYKDFL